jgi:hypothetical protein
MHMGGMRPGQYFNLAVFFTNLLTLFRGSQVASYFESEELLFQVTVREYMEMAGSSPLQGAPLQCCLCEHNLRA